MRGNGFIGDDGSACSLDGRHRLRRGNFRRRGDSGRGGSASPCCADSRFLGGFLGENRGGFGRSFGFRHLAEMLADLYSSFHFNGTGMGLFLCNTGLRQIVDDCLSLDLEFPGQLVDTNLIAIRHAPRNLRVTFVSCPRCFSVFAFYRFRRAVTLRSFYGGGF